MRGVAHVGVFQELAAQGLLGCVKEVVGISAGSLFGLFWVLGYSLADCERLALEFDFTRLRTIDVDKILDFPFTFGLDSGEGLERLIRSLLRHQSFSEDLTFAELAAARPVALRCFATELQTGRVREFSAAKTPDVPVRVGLRASMSLPILYTPVAAPEPDVQTLLVDGGLLNNLPLAFLTPEEIAETWAVLFVAGGGAAASQSRPVDSVLEFFRYMYDAALLMKTLPFTQAYKDHLICIDTHDFNSVNFDITHEERMELLQKARKATLDFLGKRRRRGGGAAARRFSVA